MHSEANSLLIKGVYAIVLRPATGQFPSNGQGFCRSFAKEPACICLCGHVRGRPCAVSSFVTRPCSTSTYLMTSCTGHSVGSNGALPRFCGSS